MRGSESRGTSGEGVPPRRETLEGFTVLEEERP